MEEQIVKQMVVAPHSVEISYNAKGEVSFCVKVYGADPEAARAQAVEIAAKLKKELKP